MKVQIQLHWASAEVNLTEKHVHNTIRHLPVVDCFFLRTVYKFWSLNLQASAKESLEMTKFKSHRLMFVVFVVEKHIGHIHIYCENIFS